MPGMRSNPDGAVVFFPSYLIRVLDIPLAQIGREYGAVAAVAAISGNLGGGFLADRAARRNFAWVAWLPAIGLALSWPLFEALLLVSDLSIFLALMFFVANLVGLGLGPIITGALSDLFTSIYGEVGIRYALMLVMTLVVPGGWFMYLCGRHLISDTEP